MKPERPIEDPTVVLKRLEKEFRSSHGNNKALPIEHKKPGGNNWVNHVASALEEKEKEEDERWRQDN